MCSCVDGFCVWFCGVYVERVNDMCVIVWCVFNCKECICDYVLYMVCVFVCVCLYCLCVSVCMCV